MSSTSSASRSDRWARTWSSTRPARRVGQPQRPAHRRRNERLVGDRHQVDEPHAVAPAVGHRAGDRRGQPGLAHAPGPERGHEAMRLDGRHEAGDLGRPAHEGRQRDGHRPTGRRDGRRHLVAAAAVGSGLVRGARRRRRWSRTSAPRGRGPGGRATSSLRSKDDTWLSTVRTETNRRAAISAFVARSATSSSTSASRSDTPASISACRSATPPVCRYGGGTGCEFRPLSGHLRGRSVVHPWWFRGGHGWRNPWSGAVIGSQTDEETPMNHHETIALAEQHRSALLADAAGTRRAPFGARSAEVPQRARKRSRGRRSGRPTPAERPPGRPTGDRHDPDDPPSPDGPAGAHTRAPGAAVAHRDRRLRPADPRGRRAPPPNETPAGARRRDADDLTTGEPGPDPTSATPCSARATSPSPSPIPTTARRRPRRATSRPAARSGRPGGHRRRRPDRRPHDADRRRRPRPRHPDLHGVRTMRRITTTLAAPVVAAALALAAGCGGAAGGGDASSAPDAPRGPRRRCDDRPGRPPRPTWPSTPPWPVPPATWPSTTSPARPTPGDRPAGHHRVRLAPGPARRSTTQGDWLQVALPERPNGTHRLGPTRRRRAPRGRRGDRRSTPAARTLTLLDAGEPVLTTPVAVGSPDDPTPTGAFFVVDKLDTGDAAGPYGPFAFGLSAHSDTLTEFAGGDGQVGIHGTDDPTASGRPCPTAASGSPPTWPQRARRHRQPGHAGRRLVRRADVLDALGGSRW